MASYNAAMQARTQSRQCIGAPCAAALIREAIADAGGWLPFDRFMALALYAPGLGYYARGSRQFGRMPASGSDFVTAPELSPLFGRALARQVGAGAARRSGSDEVWEFGAGSGALAAQLLRGAGRAASRATPSSTCPAALRERQRERLRAVRRARCAGSMRCPRRCSGVVVGNEVLDAMPVQLLHFDGARWFERGVVAATATRFAWADRPTDAAPAGRARPFVPGTVDRDPPAGRGLRRHAGRAPRSAARRSSSTTASPRPSTTTRSARGGTLMCHRAHRGRRRSAGRRRREGHHRARRLHRHRAGRRRTPAWTCSATPRRRASCSTAASTELLAGRRPARSARARAEAAHRARDGRAVQGASACARGIDDSTPIGFAAGDRTPPL